MKVIKNSILFKFLDETKDGGFKNKTSWGFEILDRRENTKHPRWGEVIAVGPKTKAVKKGDYILIEPLMWTLGIEVDSTKFWSTNEDKVLLVSKELPVVEI
jgi:co-chaperonin GroES (HSP10)